MTLACEDGHQIEAHKVILSLSSPVFENLLKRNKHNHPMIHMRGMKSEDLVAIIDFLYCGEANVNQENLDSFLAIAEELKLKGLMGQDTLDDTIQKSKVIPKKEHLGGKRNEGQVIKTEQTSSTSRSNDKSIAIPNYVSGDLKELDEKVKSMMEKTSNMMKSGATQAYIYKCKVCGKEGAGIAIRDHIEANHMEGIALPCNNCGKAFRSRQSLRHHKCNNSTKHSM